MQFKPVLKPKAREFVRRHPAQDKRYTWLVGAVRSTKTVTLSLKQLRQLLTYPVGGRRFMFGSTKQTLYRNVLMDLLETVGADNFAYNSSSGELFLFGQRWFCAGAKDEGSYKHILGSTIGIAICDEVVEYPQSFLQMLLTRMSPPGARLYGSTNPGSPYCYFKKEILNNQAMAPDTEVINFSIHDNPHLDEATKRAIIASQVGVYKLRYIDGLWVVAEGSIYRDSWDPKFNTYTDAQRPLTLRSQGGHIDHWFACDAGVDHPQVYGEFYDDGTRIYLDRVWRWDSRKEMKQLTDAEYVQELIKFMGPENIGCEIRLPPEALSLKNEMIRNGLWVVSANNDVLPGIQTCSSLFTRRLLMVNTDNGQQIEERIPTYSWDPNAAKRGEDKPLKRDDDDVDMLRYGVHGKISPWRWGIPEEET